MTASRQSQDPRLYSIKPRMIGMKWMQCWELRYSTSMATSGRESHQSWDKIVKVQVETPPEKTSRKGYMMNWERRCRSHFSAVWPSTFWWCSGTILGRGEELHHQYPQKIQSVLLHQFLKHIEHLNSYVKILPYLYYSPMPQGKQCGIAVRGRWILATHVYVCVNQVVEGIWSQWSFDFTCYRSPFCWFLITSRQMSKSMTSPLAPTRQKGLQQNEKWNLLTPRFWRKHAKGWSISPRNISTLQEAQGTYTTHNTVTATGTALMGHPISPAAQVSLIRKTTTKVMQTLCR